MTGKDIPLKTSICLAYSGISLVQTPLEPKYLLSKVPLLQGENRYEVETQSSVLINQVPIFQHFKLKAFKP